MQYVAQEALVAPARVKSALWRLMIGLALAVVIYVAGIAALFALLVAISGWDGAQMWLVRMAEADSPTATLLVLSTFIGMGLGPLAAARLLHGRPLGSLFGARPRLLRHFAIATGICVLIYAIAALIPTGITPERNLPTGIWATFLPLALVAVLVQTGAEEVLFRGYIQTQLAARFASPMVWMLIPSVIFASLHYQPDIFGENAWMMVCAVFVFAMLAADLTAYTGTIGAAWGFHFANNCGAILIVGIEGPLSGLALYTLPEGVIAQADLGWMLAMDVTVMIIVWAVIRRVVGRVVV
ncbi:lysostaphin resistance A-like protein [Roseicyclus sp.]|uniref:CPBP family intramembrane glutamic endopeptidase n=1 Tax=Roseicyclus sp. TaxID=1914329 RepID=UPI003F6BCE56